MSYKSLIRKLFQKLPHHDTRVSQDSGLHPYVNSKHDNRSFGKYKLLMLVIMFVFFLLFIASMLLFYTAVNFNKLYLMDMLVTLMPQAGLSPNVNILILGIDDTEGVQRSDSIMLLHLDVNQNKVGILSIPRDLRVDLPGRGQDKINHAYAFGGASLSVKTVAAFLQVPIDNYVEVRLSGLIRAIDELGGITVDVEKRLHYSDKAGHLYINLQPGRQILTGTQAMGYVRFRHDVMSDLGRIKRQQTFVKAIAAKVIESNNIFSTPAIFRGLISNCSSDLTAKQLLFFGLKIRSSFVANNVVVDTIPGEPVILNGISYLRPDIPGVIKSVDKVINGIANIEVQVAHVTENVIVKNVKRTAKLNMKAARGGQAISSRTINRILPTLKQVPTGAILPEGMHLSVEVLNGTNRKAIAKKLAHELKAKGIKIARVANAANVNYDKTLVVDWGGMTQEVMQLANALKINPEHIISYHKPGKKVEVTIVLGKDWPGLSTGN